MYMILTVAAALVIGYVVFGKWSGDNQDAVDPPIDVRDCRFTTAEFLNYISGTVYGT